MAEKVKFEDVRAINESDHAVLCIIEGNSYWIPKSQIDDDSEVWLKGQEGELVITEWIALKKGLI